MEYNYNKLKGRIIEYYGNYAQLAEKLGVSNALLSQKLSNKKPFSQKMIEKIIVLLELNREDILTYFFTEKVKNS